MTCLPLFSSFLNQESQARCVGLTGVAPPCKFPVMGTFQLFFPGSEALAVRDDSVIQCEPSECPEPAPPGFSSPIPPPPQFLSVSHSGYKRQTRWEITYNVAGIFWGQALNAGFRLSAWVSKRRVRTDQGDPHYGLLSAPASMSPAPMPMVMDDG